MLSIFNIIVNGNVKMWHFGVRQGCFILLGTQALVVIISIQQDHDSIQYIGSSQDSIQYIGSS